MRLDIAGAAERVALPHRGRALSTTAARLLAQAGALAGLLALALVVRIVWIAFSDWQPTPDDDAFRYDFTARALADGLGYVHLNGEPTAFWPPGYPLLLAGAYTLFGQSLQVAQLLNAVLGVASVAVVYLLGRAMFGARPALIAAAIVAVFPSLVFFTAVTLSEVAFTFFALLGVLLLFVEARAVGVRERNLPLLFAAGLVLGFASLIRGQALLLPLVLVPFWLASGVSWRGAGHRIVALAFAMGLIVAPWTIRNAAQMDAPVLIATNAGVDFWIGHHESASGDFGATGGDELVFRYPELSSVEREVRASNDGFREGLEFAVTHPAEELVLPFKKLFWLYNNDEEGLRWNEGHEGQRFLSAPLRTTLLGVSNVYYFALISVLVLSVPLWLSLRDPARLLLISLAVYWTLIHLVFFGDPRFHAPIMPVWALLAALPLAALAGRGAPPTPPGTPEPPDGD